MFDIDKMYLILPEFKTIRYDYRKAKEDYGRLNRMTDKVFAMFTETEFIEETTEDFKEWFERNKENYKYDRPKIRYVKYDSSKSVRENTVQQRNNMLLNMMWGVLTNPDTVDKQLNPGNFDKAKAAARIMVIARNADAKKLEKILGTKNFIEKLSKMSWKELDKIAEQFTVQLNPLSPTTQLFFHDQNATGGKMIGIYANHNVSHAMSQHTKLGCIPFIVNGIVHSSLHDIMNYAGEYITRNISNFLAASVDNVKDPVLKDLMQNPITGDVACFLLRAGVKPVDVGLILNQPIMVDIINALKEHPFDDAKITIKKVINSWAKVRSWTTPKEDVERFRNLLSEDMFNAILYEKQMYHPEDFNKNPNKENLTKGEKGWYNFQLYIGNAFSNMYETAASLGTLTQITRADTSNGAAGPGIAQTLGKINRITSFKNSLDESNLINADILDFHVPKEGEDIYETVQDSLLPFINSFTIAGIGGSMKLMSKYFPFFRTSIYEALFNTDWGIASYTKKGQVSTKIIEAALNDIMVYALTRTEFFGTYMNEEGNRVGGYGNRKGFIFGFPRKFQKIVAENPDIAANRFVSRLKISYPRKNSKKDPPNPRIVFKNSGRLSTIQKSMYTRDWLSLLFSDNPVSVQLGIDLFKYDMFQGGLGFGPNSFGHMASVLLRKAIPGYEETLRKMTRKEDYSAFVRQFILNHMDMPQLVPQFQPEVLDKATVTSEGKYEVPSDTPGFKKSVYVIEDVGGETILFNVPIPFFCKVSKNGVLSYYEADNIQYAEDQPFSYHLVQPLGFKGKVLEYEYGATEMNSVFYNIQRYNEGSSDSNNFEDGGQGLEIPEPIVFDSVEKKIIQAPQGIESTSKPKDISQYEPQIDPDEYGDISCGLNFSGTPIHRL